MGVKPHEKYFTNLSGLCQMPRLGDKLKELRGLKSLYQVEQDTGISRKELSRYEKGEYGPSPKNMEKIAEYYAVTYKELRKLYYDDFFSDPKERDIVLEWAREKEFHIEVEK